MFKFPLVAHTHTHHSVSTQCACLMSDLYTSTCLSCSPPPGEWALEGHSCWGAKVDGDLSGFQCNNAKSKTVLWILSVGQFFLLNSILDMAELPWGREKRLFRNDWKLIGQFPVPLEQLGAHTLYWRLATRNENSRDELLSICNSFKIWSYFNLKILFMIDMKRKYSEVLFDVGISEIFQCPVLLFYP